MRPRRPRRQLEDVIAGLAVTQHGVVTYAQLREAGLSGTAVQRRVQEGRLRRLHRGVYLVGPLVPSHARETAAVLACGGRVVVPRPREGPLDAGHNASSSAIVSHGSAAALWELAPPQPEDASIQITTSAGGLARRVGIRIHRVGTLHPDDVTVLHGVPLTTPARTLCDIARTLAKQDLERAVAQALARGIATREQFRSTLGRYAYRPGISRLRAAVGGKDEPALTRSVAEARFLELLRRAGAPPPAVNTRVAGFEVDFLWRAERFIVEVDGFAYHSSRVAFENDRARDATLAAAGMRVVRVTWRQIVHDPEALVFRLAQALIHARP